MMMLISSIQDTKDTKTLNFVAPQSSKQSAKNRVGHLSAGDDFIVITCL